MRAIVWSAVIATTCAAGGLAVALLGGPDELVLALGLGGVVAALLNLQN